MLEKKVRQDKGMEKENQSSPSAKQEVVNFEACFSSGHLLRLVCTTQYLSTQFNRQHAVRINTTSQFFHKIRVLFAKHVCCACSVVSIHGFFSLVILFCTSSWQGKLHSYLPQSGVPRTQPA